MSYAWNDCRSRREALFTEGEDGNISIVIRQGANGLAEMR